MIKKRWLSSAASLCCKVQDLYNKDKKNRAEKC